MQLIGVALPLVLLAASYSVLGWWSTFHSVVAALILSATLLVTALIGRLRTARLAELGGADEYDDLDETVAAPTRLARGLVFGFLLCGLLVAAFACATQTSIYDHFANAAGRGLLAQIAPLEERQEWDSVVALLNAFNGDVTPAMRRDLAAHKYEALLAIADRIELGRTRCTRFHDAATEAERF